MSSVSAPVRENESADMAGDKQNSASGRPKVLISAFYCGPGRGSEQGNGWNWTMQAARNHDVCVLTCSESAQQIEECRSEWESKGIEFVVWNVPGWPLRLINPFGPLRFLVLIYYVLWQITVLPLAFRLHRKHRFDLVHHVTFNTVEVPGFLWLLKIPFIWGPVGGAQIPPRSLKQNFGWGWIGEEFRTLRKILVPWNPIVRLALRRASTVLVANSDTERLLRQCRDHDYVREVDVGVNPAEIAPRTRQQPERSLTVLWAGLLIGRKGPLLALEAVAEARRRGHNVYLRIAGDGAMRSTIDQRIEELGLTGAVERLGALSSPEMKEFYRTGDTFLFSSLHDTSGTVILEAMANYLPVITLNHQGARDMVDADSGILVPIGDQPETVEGLADAIVQLCSDREMSERMGAAARARVEEKYSWNRRADVLRRIYSAALERTDRIANEDEIVRDGRERNLEVAAGTTRAKAEH